MKILVLTSGGDAPGMNMVLYLLYKRFHQSLYACIGGFKGLINNDIVKIKDIDLKNCFNEAGSKIKCSRSVEFKEKTGFNRGLKNAQDYDCVIILGGNGSYKGALDLAQNGVKTIFIPSTIDNDVDISDYSQGYDTAVCACCEYIDMVMPTMQSFNRCCVFETMGRKCSRIAQEVFSRKKCDYLIKSEEDIDYLKISNIVNENYNNNNASSIILRENIIDLQNFIKNLSEYCKNVEIKSAIIGYIQRGKKPTNIELNIAKKFSKLAIKAVKNNYKCSAVVYKNGKFELLLTNFEK